MRTIATLKTVVAAAAILAVSLSAPANAYPPGKSPLVASAPKSCAAKKSCVFIFKQVKPGTSVSVTVGKVKASAKASVTGDVKIKLILPSKAKSVAWVSSKIEGKAFKGTLAVK